MKKILLLCATIMCLFGCTEDEAPIFGDIYGVVSDSATGEPIYNASVTLSPTNKTIVTGREGHFEFTNLEAGQYSIKVSADGYQGNSTQITVIPGKKAQCDIQMSKKSVSDLFTLSTDNLNFGSTQTQMSVEITNNSSQEAEWHLDLGDDNLWIKASPISGRLAAGRTASIRFTCNRTTVTKDRSGIVNITISGDDRPITVSCSPSEQVSSQMEITPLDVDFGSESLEQVICIKNTSQALLNWTLEDLEGKPLTAEPRSGTVQPGNAQDIDLILDRSKISSDFVTSFTISDGTNKQQINVYASADDENNLVTLSTNELNFGADKSSLTLTVTAGNIGAEVSWKSSLDNSPLTSSPSTAKISPNSAKAFTINLDRTKFSGVLETAYSLYIDYDGDGEQTLGVKVLATNTEDEAPESNKIYYTTNNGVAAQFHADNFTTSVKSHTYDNGQGVIIFNDPLTSIGEYAFQECENITSITLPNSITEIQAYAFSECSALKSISLPEGLEAMGSNAFSHCEKLVTATIPSSIKEMGNYIFSGCTSLVKVELPATLTAIPSSMFKNCSALARISLPESITSVGSGAFEGCVALTSLAIPNNVTSIGGNAFRGCSALTDLTLPEQLTSISKGLFYGCSSLTSIVMPDNVTEINPEELFEGCTSLQEVILPQNITEIPDRLFSGCSTLTSITIPEKVTSIGDHIFYGCTSLTEIRFLSTTPPSPLYDYWRVMLFGYDENIPNTLKIYVPEGAYNAYVTSEYWSHYAHFIETYHGDIEGFTPDAMPNNQIWYISSDHAVIEPNYSTAFGNATIQSNVYEGGKGVITFDKDVTTIGAEAFSNITNLVRIIIPKSITSIKEKAFSATKLSSIIIPESVTSLSNNAFEGCNSLSAFYGKYASADNRSLVVDGVLIAVARANISSCTIPEGVTAISDNVFAQTSLTSVTLPSTLETIGNYAFYQTPITEITLPAALTSIGESAFAETDITKITSNATNLTMVGVSAFSSCALESATFNSIKAIGNSAFYNCRNLKSITLPDTETIGAMAFAYSGLPEISLPKTLQSIGDEVFFYSALQKFTIIAGPTYGKRVFYYCQSLTEIIIEDGVTTIPEEAFELSGIKQISIPNSVTKIGNNAFVGCGQLREIIIPGNVQTIGSYAFVGCSNLLSVTLNEGIKTIGGNAFTGCAMYTVTLPKSLESLGYYSFSECTNLTEVYSPSETPSSMSNGNAFQGFASGFTIYVPTDSVEAYKTAWSSYADYITAYDFSAE